MDSPSGLKRRGQLPTTYKNNASISLNRKPVLACSADCPSDNHARQLAQFLYETLHTMPPKLTNKINSYGKFLQ